MLRGKRRVVWGPGREVVSKEARARAEGMEERRSVRVRETESSKGLVGPVETLDPGLFLGRVEEAEVTWSIHGRRAERPLSMARSTLERVSGYGHPFLSSFHPSSASSLAGSLAPPPSVARPRPRLWGGLRSRPAPPPLLRPGRPHSPEPPGQRAPRPRPARPGQARVPRPGPPPRAMESRPPGSRRVSHPAPLLSLTPDAAAAPPPHPIPARPWRAGYLSFRLVLGLSGPSPIAGAVPTNLWIPAGTPRLLPPYWIPPPLLLRSLESPKSSDFPSGLTCTLKLPRRLQPSYPNPASLPFSASLPHQLPPAL